MLFSDKEFFIFQIIDRNVEIGQTANNNQVLSIARESHAYTSQGRLKLKIGNKPLAGHLIDVAAWVKAILSRSDQAIVVGRSHTTVTVSSWAPKFK